MSGLNDLFNFTLPSEITKMLQEGNIPEGSRTFRRDIVDDSGNKIGEKVIRTFSSGRNRPSRELVKSSYPPVNIYTDSKDRRVYEFACAGYDPKNISFEINKEDPDFIDLILNSGNKPEAVAKRECDCDETCEEKKEVAKTESKKVEQEIRAYEVEGFKVKDARVPFYIDTSRFNIENPMVEIVNGVVRIYFEPKKVNFKPKFI